jgi:ComEC/Rec2-related protein
MVKDLAIGDIAFGVASAFLFGVLAASLGWNIFILVAVVAISFLSLIYIRARQKTRVVSGPSNAGPTMRHSFRSIKGLPCFGKNAASLGLLVLVSALFGSFYFHAYLHVQALRTGLPFGKAVSFDAIITDEPKQSEKFELLTVMPTTPNTRELEIFAPLGGNVQYGDELQVKGTISPPQHIGDDPAVFPKSLIVIAEHKGFWLREDLIDFKWAMLEKFNAVLPADDAALLSGMTFGGTDGMSADVKNEMSLSGTSYIASMYGYKMNVAVGILTGVLAGFVARRWRFLLALSFVFLFVLMAGGEPSVIRAAIMIIMTLLARELGRAPNVRNALTLTAAAMVLWNPTILVQPDFALSFLSLAGIIYLGPPLERFFHENEAIVVSVSSLLAIVPVVANAFGTFPLTAFLSNALIFPVIPIAMFFGCAIALAGCVSQYLALFIGKLAEIILWYAFVIIKFFSVLVVPLPIAFNALWQFVLYYAILALFIYRHGKHLSSLA